MSDQTMDALNQAQRVRLARAHLCDQVRAGAVTLRDALDHEHAQTDLAFSFIASAAWARSYPKHQRERAALLTLLSAGLPAHLYVSELTSDDRDRIPQHVRVRRRGRPRRDAAPRTTHTPLHRRTLSATPADTTLPPMPLAKALDVLAARAGYRTDDAMDWAGVSQHSISSWRRGVTRPTLTTADRVLSTTDLLWWEVWPPDAFPDVARIFDPEEAAAA